MSVIRLYFDEDSMDADVVDGLRLHNVDVITAADAGMLSRNDESQIQWALENNRVIYTFNIRDFYRIHTSIIKQTKTHKGIILGQQSYSIGEQIRRIRKLVFFKSAEEMENQVEFLSAWQVD